MERYAIHFLQFTHWRKKSQEMLIGFGVADFDSRRWDPAID